MLKAPAAPSALVDIVHCSKGGPQSMQDDVYKEVDETIRERRKRRRQSPGRSEQSQRHCPKT
jgi:hypothetical protein